MTALLNKIVDDNKKGATIKLLTVYMFVEIAKKPLKAYYEIMRLKREKQSVVTTVDLECLID